MSEGWISVKDRLPPEMRDVLTYSARGVWIGHYGIEVDKVDEWKSHYFDEEIDFEESFLLRDVTHWMPLPTEIPKKVHSCESGAPKFTCTSCEGMDTMFELRCPCGMWTTVKVCPFCGEEP